MGTLLLFILSGVLTSVLVMLRQFYGALDLSELRRRSRRGDEASRLVYEVARHGRLANVILFLFALIFAAIYLVSAAELLDWTPTIILIIGSALVLRILAVHYSLIKPIAMKLAPSLARILVALRPLAGWLRRPVEWLFFSRPTQLHYRRSRLMELLQQQADQAPSAKKHEIQRAMHILAAADVKVEQIMRPFEQARLVASDEPLSPILMDELHASGWLEFPVYLEDKDNIVGVLRLTDIVERKMSGQVFSAMREDVRFCQTTDHIYDVLPGYVEDGVRVVLVRREDELVGIFDPLSVVGQLLFDT